MLNTGMANTNPPRKGSRKSMTPVRGMYRYCTAKNSAEYRHSPISMAGGMYRRSFFCKKTGRLMMQSSKAEKAVMPYSAYRSPRCAAK